MDDTPVAVLFSVDLGFAARSGDLLAALKRGVEGPGHFGPCGVAIRVNSGFLQDEFAPGE